jgi:hypothetical protein
MLCQKHVETILQKIVRSNCRTKSTPMQMNTILSKEGDDYTKDTGVYAEILGMLLYLSSCTRPGIAHAVGVLARFMPKPRSTPTFVWDSWRVGIQRDAAAGVRTAKVAAGAALVGALTAEWLPLE